MKERTLCIVKPDAMRKRVAGRILAMIEERGLVPVAARILTLAPGDAERFYAVHRERKFFPDLVRFMSSGPVLVAFHALRSPAVSVYFFASQAFHCFCSSSR